uniref:Exoribonuclease phosphorolytic domain-containing protein n=1 Tax=Timema tahoe TaxID=61484 RepID=A0A7R9IKU1_9NEOP|nr:unnamed protein product [Timema tahoe]
MPMDTRRVQGPDNSKPYLLFAKKKDKSYKDILSDLVCNDLKTGVVTQAKGSAYMELNKTKVICSVYDPREIPGKTDYSMNGELYCEFKFAPFSCITRRGHQHDTEEKEFSLNLKRALEPAVCRHEFPNFQVDVYAQVIENDGSALAAAITCAGLALADACVPMYDLVTAATLGIHGDLHFKDPTHEEEMLCSSAPPEGSPSRSYGIITAAYSPTHNQVSEFSHQGSIDMDTLAAVIPTFTETCHLIYPVIKQVLISNVTKTIKKRKKEALFQISGDE